MIFVILGTHERPFYRLVKEIDNLSSKNKIKDKFIIQMGVTKYKFKSKKIKSYEYIPQKDFDKYLKNSKILITHGGAGSIMTGIRIRKPIITVPRLSKFGEHVNDHQLQIVKEMEKHGAVDAVYDINKLFDSIRKSSKIKLKNIKKQKSPIFKIVDKKLGEWNKK